MNDAPHDATQPASYDIDEAVRTSRPARVGRYEVGEALGSGSMGVVYRARDPELDRALAIKLVRTDAGSASSGLRLLREAQAMARLRHPNVVPIFDVGPVDNAVFVAMPLLEGGTLRSWLRDARRSLDDILDRFVAAGRGLAAAHAAGLIHRDFKPDNVLLGNDGEVHVADFGLARLADRACSDPAIPISGSEDTETQTGEVVGTPAYMAPEQLRGRPSDARADQFSFCVALWEGAYGGRPFGKLDRGADPLVGRIASIADGPVTPPRRDRPAWLAHVLARGLAADPDRRWPSMTALLDAIAAHRAPRRRPWRLVAAVVALAAAAAIFALDRPDAPAPALSVIALTHRSDLRHAAISPDGRKLAFVAGASLVIRGVDPDADDRVILDHGIADLPIAWSPDGHHLLVATDPEIATQIRTELVDIDDASHVPLATPGMAAFLSGSEIAVTAFRRRSVDIVSLDRAATAATCKVPGDYAFLWRVIGLPDGTIVVQTRKGESYGLVILDRSCRIRREIADEPIASIATTDTGTIVALEVGDGLGEILEFSLDGAILSRRRVSADLDQILGRRHGIDYVSTLSQKTHLDRVRPGQAGTRLVSVTGTASFTLSPDGDTLAWIENGGRDRGMLRITTVAGVARRDRPVLDNALMAGWSPDGRALAVLIDRGGEAAISVIDRSGAELRRLPLHHLDRGAAPVWLDDHQIAAQTDDRTTYRWFDLISGAQGEIVDSRHGSTYWLARSPRDGMLAMWRNGPPDATSATAEHLWIQPVGQAARPLAVRDAVKHYLLPSWSPGGELLVRALETGELSRVALDTGELTPVAQLPRAPVRSSFDDHVMTLSDGDLLAVEIELGIDVLAVRPDDDARPRPRREPEPGQL